MVSLEGRRYEILEAGRHERNENGWSNGMFRRNTARASLALAAKLLTLLEFVDAL